MMKPEKQSHKTLILLMLLPPTEKQYLALLISLLKAVTPTIQLATNLQSCSTHLLEIEVKDS